ncbi:MAG: DUF4476 domain-containing protein [Paludibacteraceae bacterium]|nr:DUF4476 domain-containing protein [Paludibacteraceae bacterium]
MTKFNYCLVLLLSLLFSVGAMAQGRHHHGRNRYDCATPEEMRLTMHALEKQSFDDDRLETAILCVTLGQFCVDDLAHMAKVFSFDDNRQKFLTYAYYYCVDPENYYRLKETFTFSLSFDEMMKKLHHR